MKIAIQGELGSFHHQAAIEMFGEQTEVKPYEIFSDVFEAVMNSETDIGLIAIENSTYGAISEVQHLLLDSSLYVIGEHYLAVNHYLMSLDDIETKDLQKGEIRSMPVALGQCKKWLGSNLPSAKLVPMYDTVGALLSTKNSRVPAAAVAGKFAATTHNAKILDGPINDARSNTTRFVVLSRKPQQQGNKYSAFLTTGHKPGSLRRHLVNFESFGYNLTHLSSMPIPDNPFSYRFFVEMTGPNPMPDDLQKNEDIRILGCYESTTDKLIRHD